MVKTRNNQDLLKKLEYPLLVAKRKVEHIEAKIDKIKRDILDPPILCCKQTFISHQDLENMHHHHHQHQHQEEAHLLHHHADHLVNLQKHLDLIVNHH